MCGGECLDLDDISVLSLFLIPFFLRLCLQTASGAACVIALQHVSVRVKWVSLENWDTKCLLRLSQLK